MILQLSPLIPFLFIETYSDKELGYFRSECVDKFLSKEVEIYLEAEKAGKKVYGGIEKIKADFSVSYQELCDKIVFKKHSSFDLNGIFTVILIYTVPSFLIMNKLLKNRENFKLSKYTIAAILNIFGMILYWDFGLNAHIHAAFVGRVLL